MMTMSHPVRTDQLTMSPPSPRTIRKFNPGVFQSDREVIEQFVVRTRELDTILEVVRDNSSARSCQHLLVVGPRGRGKTMLLARVAAELRTDPGLRKKLLPVRFMEESLEVLDIGDFWLEALFHLANECSGIHPELSQEIEATRAALAQSSRGEGVAARARAALLDAADRLGKRLVLMVENMQDLAEADDDFGWQLRRSLQSDPEITLLATATSRFEALQDAGAAFFELFRVVQLKPLNTDECRKLWRVVGGEDRSARDLRPLEILTGGSPRLLVIIAEFGHHRSMPQLIEELVGLVDDHTEYFRGHLNAMPSTERRVYLAAADLWRPSSTREIADRARLGVRTTSALLGRLVSRGVVTPERDGRRRRYTVTERLYCIYYKLRRQRDRAAVVQGLIRFMVAFYTEDEAATILGSLLGDSALHDDFFRASQDIEVDELPAGMAASTYRELVKCHGDDLADPASQIEVGGELLSIAVRFGQKGDTARSIEYNEEVIRRYASIHEQAGEDIVVKAFFNKAIATQNGGDLGAAVGAFREVVSRFEESDSLVARACVATALLNEGYLHGQLGQPKAAIAVYDRATDRFADDLSHRVRLCVAMSLLNKGSILAELGLGNEAVAVWDDLVSRFGNADEPDLQLQVVGALVKRAAFWLKAARGDTAVRTCDEAVRRYGSSDDPAVRAKVALALEIKAMTQNLMGQADEALSTCDLLVSRFGDEEGERGVPVKWRALGARSRALFLQGDERAAVRVFRRMCVEIDRDDPAMLKKLVWDTIELVAGGASPVMIAEALTGLAERSEVLVPLLGALRELAGSPMRLPEEAATVVGDVIREIDRRRR